MSVIDQLIRLFLNFAREIGKETSIIPGSGLHLSFICCKFLAQGGKCGTSADCNNISRPPQQRPRVHNPQLLALHTRQHVHSELLNWGTRAWTSQM
jgi:hypothetical protein